MNENLKMFQIEFYSRDDKEVIEWPIINRTAKAIEVQTPGGPTWLPLWKFAVRSFHYKQIAQFIKPFEECTKKNTSSLLPVWKSGNGKTEKSHKFSTDVISVGGEYPGTTLTKRRVFILPVSQVKKIDDQWLAPAWLLQKHLARGESLPEAIWSGLPLVMAQLTNATNRIQAREDAIAAERSRCREVEDTKRAEVERHNMAAVVNLSEIIGDEGESAFDFCKKKFSLLQLTDQGCAISSWPCLPVRQELRYLEDLARLVQFARAQPAYSKWKLKNVGKAAMPPKSIVKKERIPDRILTNCEVDWVEWLQTSKCRVKIDFYESGCSVAFFGKKRKITLPNGDVLTKMAGPNLIIVECGNAQEA